jgi:hypothetical protein
MFYKVIYKDKVIDVLDQLVYVKYQEKYDRMILCDEREAQAILSSDEKYIWHEKTLYNIPVPGYDTVSIEKIDAYEYEQLKILKLKTLEEVIDEYTLLLIEGGIL